MTIDYQIIYSLSNVFQTYLLYKCFNIFNNRLKIRCNLAVPVIYIVYYVITTLTHLVVNDPIFMMIVNLFLLYCIELNYKNPIWQKILHIFLIYILFMIIECFVVVSVNFLFYAKYNESTLMIFSLFASKILTFALVILLETQKKCKDENVKIDMGYKISLVLFPIASIFLFHAILAEEVSHIVIMVSLVILLLFNIFITAMYDILGSKYSKELDNQFLIHQNLYYKKQLELVTENNKKIKFLHHDYQNHLIALKGAIEQNNISFAHSYLNEMLKISTEYYCTKCLNTGNIAIDSIFNYKISQAKQNFIDINYEICIPEKLNLEYIDIITIIGNLFDNALEATLKLPKESRFIDFNMLYDRNMLFVSVSNTYKELVINNDKLTTTKQDKINHGLGLHSISHIIKQYNGFIEQSWDSNTFKIQLILYLK